MLVSMLFVSASNKSSLADLILKISESSSQRKFTSTSARLTAFSAQILFSLAISCLAVIGFGCVFWFWFLVYALGGANAESWKVEGSVGIIVTDYTGF